MNVETKTFTLSIFNVDIDNMLLYKSRPQTRGAVRSLKLYNVSKRGKGKGRKGVREVIPNIGPIPTVIHLKLFLDHPYP